MASNPAIPYSLSTNYSELFDRVSKGERIAAFFDRVFSDSEKVYRDICEVYIKNDVVSVGVRGMAVIHIDDFDVKLAKRDNVTIKSLFITDCKRINLGWIKP
ncbi:hypothetical protein LMH73_015580 [Vibrio splendidus]|nr:hypothetical protein [Vibrio splendidus]MCC4882914.1 hypothetical protein [Vibrio splendidus]